MATMTQEAENKAAAAKAKEMMESMVKDPKKMNAAEKRAALLNMGFTPEEADATIINAQAGVMTTVYNLNGQVYTRSYLEGLNINVENLNPSAVQKDTSCNKGGIFDNIPDWLITAAKIALGIIAVVGLVIVVKHFALPRFFGDSTVIVDGQEMDYDED